MLSWRAVQMARVGSVLLTALPAWVMMVDWLPDGSGRPHVPGRWPVSQSAVYKIPENTSLLPLWLGRDSAANSSARLQWQGLGKGQDIDNVFETPSAIDGCRHGRPGLPETDLVDELPWIVDRDRADVLGFIRVSEID